MEPTENWKNQLLGEVLLFGLLGKILYQDPDKAWLESLAKDDVFSEAPFGSKQAEIEKGLRELQRWTKQNQTALSDKEFEKIRRDHLYLFTGVGEALAPVWESIYSGNGPLLFQKETLQVREWYARFNMQVEKFQQEPDDHIGLEFSFAAHLAALALQALESGNQPDLEAAIGSQRAFLQEHLMRWTPEWARLVRQHAQSDFYRGVALLALGALRAAGALLEDQAPLAEEAA